MKRSNIIVLLFYCSITFLAACNFSLSCDLKMTEEYIESSCGLTNGVRFEELGVDSSYEDGQPKIYTVLHSYGANPYANGPADKVKDRIYFNGDKGNCYWRKDTSTNGVYKNFGGSRELLEDINDSLERPEIITTTYITKDSMVITSNKPLRNMDVHYVSVNCPVRFKSSTWYFVDFHDQRYDAYLFVDKDMKFQLFKNNKPTNF